jgi:hypothetical protein
MSVLLFLVLTGIGLLYWMSAMRAREVALRAARLVCNREQLQLLDESVVLNRLRPARCPGGQACWRRRYGFEFSDEDGNRRAGEVELLGYRPVATRLSLGSHDLHELH